MISKNITLRGRNEIQAGKRSVLAEIARNRFAYLLIAPTVLYLLLFQMYPLVESIRISFTDLSLIKPGSGSYIGLENYKNLLFDDPQFWQIFRNSFLWVFGSTVLQFALAIPAAMVLNEKLPMRGFWRGLVMIPWVTPVVVMGIIWKWIYDGDYGLFNYYLHALHITDSNIVWLGNEFWVWPALLFTSMWKGFPYTTLMCLAGLQGISQDIYEAAFVDGADAVKRFWYITMPLLMPVVFVTGLVCIISTWTKFEVIWALTGGGPGYATSILPTYVYTQSFKFFELGMGSAVAVISAVFVFIIVSIYLKAFKAEY